MSLRCLWYLPLSLLAFPLEAVPLTLNEVFQQASARSEPIQQARLDIQRQEAAVNEAQSLQGSRVRLDAGLDAAATQVEDRDLDTGLEPNVRTEWRHPLYDGGGRKAKIEAARGSQEAARWEAVRVEEDLYLQCAELFYVIIGQEQDLANLRESEAVYRERIATLQQRARIGRSRRAEVLAAETQLEVVRAQMAASQQALRSAQSRLRWLIGGEGKLEVKDTIDFAQLRQKSPINRQTPIPAVAAAQARVAVADQRIEERRAADSPRVDFIAAHRWSTPNDLNTQALTFGVGLSWTLYDAGEISAGVAGLSLEKKRAEIQGQWLGRQAQLDLALASQEWEDGLAQIKDLEDAYAAAEKNVRLQQQEFETGLLTNLEVMQAIDTRLQVKRNLDQVKNRTKLAYVETLLRAGQWKP